jgi:4-hydroxy-tetrahydrodipicolinate synthase
MNNIYGIVPPATTPFDADGSVDLALLENDLRYLIETAGVHGIAVCGSTGEGHTLTTDETRRVTGTAVDAASGRVPVITGIIADSTRAAIERGKAVADLGVAALQVTPVHYLFRPDDNAMLSFFADIVDATGLPVMIYNVVPWAYLSPELLTRIITEVDGVIGVKQSAGDMKMLADLLPMLGNRGVVMSAVDALLYPSFNLGAHGAIAAILTAAPEQCVALWDAVQAGQHDEARRQHAGLLRLWNAIQADNLPANVKLCQALQGRPAGLPRAPMPGSSEEQRTKIEQALASLPV